MDWNAYANQQTLTPEQQQLYLKQQQEQWFEYQRQYATWNASYGEQYAREIQAQTIKPPPPPAEESQKPPEPPSDNKPTFQPNYSSPFVSHVHEPLESVGGGPSGSGNSGNKGFNNPRNTETYSNRGHNQPNWMKNRGGGQSGRDSGNYNKNSSPSSSSNNNNSNNSNNNNNSKNHGRNQNVNQSPSNNRGNNRIRGNNSNRGNMGNRFNRNPAQNQDNHYQKQQQEEYNQPQAAQPKEVSVPVAVVNEKSLEEVLFDEQFRKWEEEFDNWKKANINHPDIVAYREYEMKFEECRQKLLERREVMMKKKNDQQQITKPPKTAEQTHFENQWKAGNSTTKEANKPDKSMNHKTSNSSVMEPSSRRNDSNFHVDNYKNYEPFREEQIPSGHLDYNEEVNASSSSNWTSKTSGIPGLDLVPREKPPVEKVIDERLDDDVTAIVNLIEDEVTMMSDENNEKTNVENISAAGLSNILNNPKILELLAASLGATTSTEEKSNTEKQNQDQQQSFGRNDQLQASQFNRNDQLQASQFNRNDQQQQQFRSNDQQQSQFGRNDQQFPRNDQQQQFRSNDQQFPRNDQQQSQFGINDQQQQQFGRSDPQQFKRNDQSFNPNREIDNKQQQQNFNSNRSDYFSDNQPIKVSSDFSDNSRDNRQQQQRPGIQSLLEMPLNESNKFNQNQNQRNLPMDVNRFNNDGNNFNQNQFNQNQSNFNNNPGMQRQNPNNIEHPSSQSSNFNNQPSQSNNNFNNQPNQSNNNFNNQPNQSNNNFNNQPNQSNNNFNNQANQSNNNFNNQPNQSNNNFNNQPNQSNNNFSNQQRNNFNPNNFNNPGMQQHQQQQQQNQFQQHPQQQQQNQFQQNMINNENQPVQRSLEETPTFKPAKIIDYDHRPKPSFEETLLEFRVFKTIEYNHRSKKSLLEFVAEIDVSKILEKKKQIALRKKILEYLKNADNPADTVSNPNYPKNWVVIDVERPALRNKRRKHLTSKIKRIIQQKKDHEADAKIIQDVPVQYKDTIPIMDLLSSPGRYKRPPRIVILLRGAAGSGKTYLSFLISLKEKLLKGVAPKVLRIDDFFLIDTEIKQSVKKIYEFDESMESNYMQSISEMFMKAILSQEFIIVDAPLIDLDYYMKFYDAAIKKGFTVFTCEMEKNEHICYERNIHDRSLKDIKDVIASYKPTPSHHNRINPLALFSESKEEEPNKLYALNKYNEVIANREKEYKAVKMNTDDISSEEEQFDGFSDDDDFEDVAPMKKMKMNPTIEETLKVLVDNESKRKEHLSKKISIDDLLLYPGRKSRPKRIVVILRGASGSGKSYLAKLIRDKEIEMKGSSPRTLSIDNYFIINEQETYEYDPDNENTYMENVKKSFKKTISEGFYDFVIVDCNNIDLTNYNFFYASAKQQEFACYTIEMEMDPTVCFERNIHDRTFEDIEETIKRFMPTPYEHQLVDPKSLFPVKEVFIETEEISSDEDCVMEVLPSQKTNVGAGPSSKVNVLEAVSSIDETMEASPPTEISDDENWEEMEKYDPYKDALCIDSFLCGSGRETRPSRVAIILRGLTGSGKSYLTKLIVAKEMEKCGIEPKVFSVDDQYVKDSEDPNDTSSATEYDHSMDNQYILNVEEAYNALITNVTTDFIIIDVPNVDLKNYMFFYNSLKKQGFEIYTIKLEVEPKVCLQNSGRKVTLQGLQKVWDDFEDIPDDYLILDPSALVGKAVKYKRKVIPYDDNDQEDIESFGPINKEKSKWDDDGFGSDLARLDGIKNKVKQPTTMEHYLQMDDYESEPPLESGKKRVRWADIEAKKKQIRSRERGFVVGQTDWDEMMDPSEGRSALIQTKYIERNPKK